VKFHIGEKSSLAQLFQYDHIYVVPVCVCVCICFTTTTYYYYYQHGMFCFYAFSACVWYCIDVLNNLTTTLLTMNDNRKHNANAM